MQVVKFSNTLNAIDNGGLPYYKWKVGYLSRQLVTNIREFCGMTMVALCLLLVAMGVINK